MKTKTRFEQFHKDNPQVYRELERLTREWFSKGNPHASIQMLWEVLRWEVGIDTTSSEPFKFNNNFRPHYARLLTDRNPHWADRFSFRHMNAAA